MSFVASKYLSLSHYRKFEVYLKMSRESWKVVGNCTTKILLAFGRSPFTPLAALSKEQYGFLDQRR
jgi:hypothetical protein